MIKTSSKFSSMRKWLLLIVLIGQLVCAAPSAKAGVWGESIAAELLGQALEIVKTQLAGALLGTLKTAAISILNSQVGQMIGGNSLGEALFITDWNDFIYTKPAEQAQLFMNDFFTISTRGKYASANYVGVGDVSGSVSGNYAAYLVAGAQQAIGSDGTGEESDVPLSYDLDAYSPSPDILFQEGDYRGLNAFFSNPANNPFGYTLSATAYYARKMNQSIEAAKTEAQSSGFIGKKQDGKTIAPAATIEGMLSDVENIGNNLIAAAENPGEFLSGVVSAVVNKAVTSMIQKGVGKIQANIQREVKKVDNQVVKALDKANKKLGPAAKFTKEWSQKTDVYVKPYTQAPPAANDNCSGGC